METPRKDTKMTPTPGPRRFALPPWAEVCNSDYRKYAAMVPRPIDAEMVALTLLIGRLRELAESSACDEWLCLISLAIVARRAAEDLADAADFPGDVAATMQHRQECGCSGCTLIRMDADQPQMVVEYIFDLLFNMKAYNPGEVVWLSMLVDLAAACGGRYEALAVQS